MEQSKRKSKIVLLDEKDRSWWKRFYRQPAAFLRVGLEKLRISAINDRYYYRRIACFTGSVPHSGISRLEPERETGRRSFATVQVAEPFSIGTDSIKVRSKWTSEELYSDKIMYNFG